MSVVDDASITIRAYSEQISYIKDLIQTYDLGGYYNLTFEIKDGRVKVNAPIIDEAMTRSINNAHEKDFTRMIRSWAKEGEFKEKFIKQVTYTENYQNSTINSILGSGEDSANEDW